MSATVCQGIRWVRERGEIRVIDPATDAAWLLTGAEAAVWDWLALGHPHARVVALLAALLAVEPDAAAHHLEALLQAWARQGMIVCEVDRG